MVRPGRRRRRRRTPPDSRRTQDEHNQRTPASEAAQESQQSARHAHEHGRQRHARPCVFLSPAGQRTRCASILADPSRMPTASRAKLADLLARHRPQQPERDRTAPSTPHTQQPWKSSSRSSRGTGTPDAQQHDAGEDRKMPSHCCPQGSFRVNDARIATLPGRTPPAAQARDGRGETRRHENRG